MASSCKLCALLLFTTIAQLVLLSFSSNKSLAQAVGSRRELVEGYPCCYQMCPAWSCNTCCCHGSFYVPCAAGMSCPQHTCYGSVPASPYPPKPPEDFDDQQVDLAPSAAPLPSNDVAVALMDKLADGLARMGKDRVLPASVTYQTVEFYFGGQNEIKSEMADTMVKVLSSSLQEMYHLAAQECTSVSFRTINGGRQCVPRNAVHTPTKPLRDCLPYCVRKSIKTAAGVVGYRCEQPCGLAMNNGTSEGEGVGKLP